MMIPARARGAAGRLALASCAMLLAAALAGCATFTAGNYGNYEVGLEPGKETVGLSQGRVTVVVVDEQGINLPNMKVEISWQEPSYYRSVAFTNRFGEVMFSGVPRIAEVRIDHPNGDYVQTLVVPQTGRPELRVMLDTMGEGQLMRERERSRSR
jgi:hypothetical protein